MLRNRHGIKTDRKFIVSHLEELFPLDYRKGEQQKQSEDISGTNFALYKQNKNKSTNLQMLANNTAVQFKLYLEMKQSVRVKRNYLVNYKTRSHCYVQSRDLSLFPEFPNSYHYFQYKRIYISLMDFPSSCKSGSSQTQLYV